MSTLDIIIMLVIVSIGSSIISGSVVYYLLDKKLKEESEWLLGRIFNANENVNRLHDRYIDHMIDYHTKETD